MTKVLKGLLVVSLLTLYARPTVWALGSSGLTAQVIGARVLGMGNAFAGQANDPAANYINPAGITQLEGWQVQLGISPTTVTSDYSGAGGSESMDSSWTVLPSLFLTGQLTDRLTMGFGVHTPYGLGSEWSKTGPMRYVATKSDLSTLLYNPNIAYAATDKMSFAAGVDYLQIMNAHLESQVNQSPIASQILMAPTVVADGTKKLEGDGGTWGYNFAAHFKPTEKHKFGLSYRSQMRTTIKGDVKLENIDPTIQDPATFNFGSANYQTHAEADIPFPQSTILGYSFKPNDRWVFNFDWEWTDWSKFQQLQVNYDETDPQRLALLNNGNPIPYKWKDCNAYGVGTEYTFANKVQVRGGYSYYNTVVPEAQFDPSLPENNVHNFSIGAGFPVKEKIMFDFAYYIDKYEKRKVATNKDDDNLSPSIDGEYKSVIHVLSVSATYKFGGKK